jgi:hypothetical protein
MKHLEQKSRWFRIGYWDGVRNFIDNDPDAVIKNPEESAEYVNGYKAGMKEWEEERVSP